MEWNRMDDSVIAGRVLSVGQTPTPPNRVLKIPHRTSGSITGLSLPFKKNFFFSETFSDRRC